MRGTHNSLFLISMLLLALMMLSVPLPNANAAVVGASSPGNVVSVSPGDDSWSNPDNAKIPDGSYASSTGFIGDSSYRLKATDYGFNIPSGATVRGIQVDVKRHRDSDPQSVDSRVFDLEILIVKSDGSIGANNKADTVNNWPTSDATRSYGGATDLWGEAWTPADIDSPYFGVLVRVSFSWFGSWGGTPTVTAYVDYVSITVYYDPPLTYFADQSGQHWMQVSSLGDFSIYETTGNVLLCSGVGARVTNGGLVLTIQSSSWLGSGSYVKCQAGVYRAARAGGFVSGVVTVMLSSPTRVGYPSIMVLSMSQTVALD